MLQVEGSEEPSPEVRGVEALKDVFWTLGETAVTEQETQSAESKVLLMGGHDPVCDEGHSSAIVAPMPPTALCKAAKFQRAVVFSIGERFVVAVAPAETAEDAYL